jgi:hypothetical protein
MSLHQIPSEFLQFFSVCNSATASLHINRFTVTI